MKRKCVNCKDFFPKEDGLILPIGFVHNQDCAYQYSIKMRTKRKDIEHKERKKQFIVNDVSKQKKLTQIAFNKMRVLEELQWFKSKGMVPVCISCQKPVGGDIWSCGHFKTVGSTSRLRFDRKNTYLQHNFNCNSIKSGDIDGYKRGLKLRFGDEEGQSIIDYCDSNTHPYRWTGPELVEMRREFNAKIRELNDTD